MSQRTKRLALVIGNSNYQALPNIPNAIKDATAIHQTLETLGFEVTFGINKEKREMIDCLSMVRNPWRDEANEIVVYYSGHGISIDGKMYLGPVDATEVDTDFIDDNFLAVEMIIKVLIKYRKEDKYPIIIILDCCRSTFKTDNTCGFDQDPLRGVRGDNSIKKTNIAILYSTGDGDVALDGSGSDGHSPYTQLLLESMIKDYTIDQVHGVITKSLNHGKQVPWIYHCLHQPYKFCIVPQEHVVSSLTINDPVKKRFYGVPRKNTEFVNRPTILEQIESTLRKASSLDGSNILALCGLGGMGKSQLMLHYCYHHRAAYEFIFWMEVDGWATALDSFRKLAINLGFDEENTKEKLTDEKISEWVSDCLEKMKGWLLLLNNADEKTMAKIFDFLPRIGGDIILTTREHISPKKAKIIKIDKMSEAEALSLLFGSTEIDSVDQESARYSNAKEIVAELGYMALAVDLARAYVESMSTSFKEYLSMFKTERNILFSHLDEDNLHQYSHSLKTVWQLSFDRIRIQSPLAAELLDICSFLLPDNIPVILFKRQYALLTRSSSIMSSPDIPETSTINIEALKAVQEAVAVLVKFSFIKRTLKEDGEKEDPTDDVLAIHRLVQTVIQDMMNDDHKTQLTCNLASALGSEIFYTDSYAPSTRVAMNAYIWHIRRFATMIDINKKSLLSEDLVFLFGITVEYLLDNGISSGVEELAKLVVTISESIYEPEDSPMARSLQCLIGFYQQQRNFVKAEPLCQRALAICERSLGPEHPNTGRSLNSLALLYRYQGNYAKAELLHERALAIYEKTLGPEHPITATALNNLAMLYRSQGNYVRAESLSQRSIAINEKANGPDHPSTARSLHELSSIYYSQRNYAKAEPLSEKALAIFEKILGPENPSTALSLNSLASIYESQGNYTKAESLYQQALAINEKVQGPDNLSTATTLIGLAQLFKSQANYAKAMPFYQRALTIEEKVLGPEHPEMATSLNNMAFLYTHQGDYTKAISLYQRALAINEKILGPEDLGTAVSLDSLASCYSEQGDHNKAEQLLERALIIREKKFGPDHLETTTTLCELARMYMEQGDHAKAEQLLERALMIREKELGPDHLETAVTLDYLAMFYFKQGDYAKAEQHSERALMIREKEFGPDHPEVAIFLNILGRICEGQGNYTKARHLYERTLMIKYKELGPEDPSIIDLLYNLASLYLKLRDYAKAEPLFEQALVISEKNSGPEHINTAACLNNLAMLYVRGRNYAKAEPFYQRALEIYEKALGPEHPNTATSLNNLGGLYEKQGDYAKAETFYERALKIYEKKFGPDHQSIVDNLANLYDKQGNFAKAELLYKQAQVIYEKEMGLEHLCVAKSLYSLALLCFKHGDCDKAEPLFEQALMIFEKTLGSKHPEMATYLNNIAMLYSRQGDNAKAIPFSVRALAINESVFGPEHSSTGISLNNLASLYESQGNHAKAVLLRQRALAILEKEFGPEHPITVLLRDNSASTANNQSTLNPDRSVKE